MPERTAKELREALDAKLADCSEACRRVLRSLPEWDLRRIVDDRQASERIRALARDLAELRGIELDEIRREGEAR